MKSSLSGFDSAKYKENLEARVGIEPTHKGFADLSLTTWVPRHISHYKSFSLTSDSAIVWYFSAICTIDLYTRQSSWGEHKRHGVHTHSHYTIAEVESPTQKTKGPAHRNAIGLLPPLLHNSKSGRSICAQAGVHQAR